METWHKSVMFLFWFPLSSKKPLLMTGEWNGIPYDRNKNFNLIETSKHKNPTSFTYGPLSTAVLPNYFQKNILE